LILPRDGSQPSTITVFAFSSEDIYEASGVSVVEAHALVGQWPVVWVNVDGLGDASVLEQFGAAFGIHRLALEDITNRNQRAKVEEYGDVYFIVTPIFRFGEGLEDEQLCMILGANFVITFQEQPGGDCFDPLRTRIRNDVGQVRKRGSDYLMYSILDATVDAYFPLLERIGETLEDYEAAVLVRTSVAIVSNLHGVKRNLLTLRRAIWPLREAVNALVRDENPRITSDTRIYLRDCYDHIVRVMDLIETSRELGSDLTDLYLSQSSYRLNEVMRILTVFATVFIPLTLITGLYGMNFTTDSPYNLPELHWKYGYIYSLCLMAAVTATTLYYFWRKGWIGKDPNAGPPDGAP
jgi:magnesium transporter